MVVWAGITAPTAAPLGAPIAMPTRAAIPREDPPKKPWLDPAAAPMPAPIAPPTTKPITACSPRRAPEAVETRTTSLRFTETSEPFSCRVSVSSVTLRNSPAWRLMLDSMTSIPWPALRPFRLDHEPCCFWA